MGERFLQGRAALVTGSTSGIGLAIAQALGSAGARVAVNGLGSHEQVEAAVASVCQAGAPDATPGPTPTASSARCSAAVPELTATACSGVVSVACSTLLRCTAWWRR